MGEGIIIGQKAIIIKTLLFPNLVNLKPQVPICGLMKLSLFAYRYERGHTEDETWIISPKDNRVVTEYCEKEEFR